MTYDVKSPILGFENIDKMELSEIDELFATLRSAGDEGIAFTLVNPYLLREYSFDVPRATQALLDIKDDSHLLVYNLTILQDPLEESKIDFLAPLLFNTDNQTMVQLVLDPKKHPEYDLAETIKDFK